MIRGVWQLRQLRIRYCKWSGSSAGARLFLQETLPSFTEANPQVEVDVAERSNKSATVEGVYANGVTKCINVGNRSPNEVLGSIMYLRNQTGRRHVRLHDQRQSTPSVQGWWTPKLHEQAEGDAQLPDGAARFKEDPVWKESFDRHDAARFVAGLPSDVAIAYPGTTNNSIVLCYSPAPGVIRHQDVSVLGEQRLAINDTERGILRTYTSLDALLAFLRVRKYKVGMDESESESVTLAARPATDSSRNGGPTYTFATTAQMSLPRQSVVEHGHGGGAADESHSHSHTHTSSDEHSAPSSTSVSRTASTPLDVEQQERLLRTVDSLRAALEEERALVKRLRTENSELLEKRAEWMAAEVWTDAEQMATVPVSVDDYMRSASMSDRRALDRDTAERRDFLVAEVRGLVIQREELVDTVRGLRRDKLQLQQRLHEYESGLKNAEATREAAHIEERLMRRIGELEEEVALLSDARDEMAKRDAESHSRLFDVEAQLRVEREQVESLRAELDAARSAHESQRAADAENRSARHRRVNEEANQDLRVIELEAQLRAEQHRINALEAQLRAANERSVAHAVVPSVDASRSTSEGVRHTSLSDLTRAKEMSVELEKEWNTLCNLLGL